MPHNTKEGMSSSMMPTMRHSATQHNAHTSSTGSGTLTTSAIRAIVCNPSPARPSHTQKISKIARDPSQARFLFKVNDFSKLEMRGSFIKMNASHRSETQHNAPAMHLDRRQRKVTGNLLVRDALRAVEGLVAHPLGGHRARRDYKHMNTNARRSIEMGVGKTCANLSAPKKKSHIFSVKIG